MLIGVTLRSLGESKWQKARQPTGNCPVDVNLSVDQMLGSLWAMTLALLSGYGGRSAGEVGTEDFSDNLIVQLGTVTEDLNRRWYERNTGHSVGSVQKVGPASR